jgi:hypothetical protein
MTNTAPITLAQLWRHKAAPGTEAAARQDASIAELEAELRKGRPYGDVMRRSEAWFHTWSQGKKLTDKPHPEAGLLLTVPYFRQRDSETDQGLRMCFSSSCAMLLATIRPGLIHGPNADDQYLARVRMYGDTTSHLAQTRALASYGVNADFTKRADFAAIERSIHRGVPVPVGYLHRGPVSAPAGGGHWAIVIGYDQDALILHDPWGEADMVTGATIARTGEGVRYSRKNFARRWMVEGPGTGWAIIAR